MPRLKNLRKTGCIFSLFKKKRILTNTDNTFTENIKYSGLIVGLKFAVCSDRKVVFNENQVYIIQHTVIFMLC